MKFKQIPTDTFQKLAINAGILAHNFSPDTETLLENLKINGVLRRNIIGATSGGITFTGTPTFADFGEDVDNCPKNTKEMKRITAWDVKISGTFVMLDENAARELLGGADKICIDGVDAGEGPFVGGQELYTRSGSGTAQSPYVYTLWDGTGTPGTLYYATAYKIIPRLSLDASDFEDTGTGAGIACGDFADLWFIGDYSDVNTGNDAGFVAIRVMNALSTGGFSMVTADQEKGKFAFEYTGHYTLDDPDEVPFEVYIHAGDN